MKAASCQASKLESLSYYSKQYLMKPFFSVLGVQECMDYILQKNIIFWSKKFESWKARNLKVTEQVTLNCRSTKECTFIDSLPPQAHHQVKCRNEF